LTGVGNGGAENHHQGHLHGERELSPHAVVPIHSEVNRIAAGENYSGKINNEGQDQTKYEGIGDYLISGKLELLAKAPKEIATVLIFFRHTVFSFSFLNSLL